jgi:hypothetical protein
MKLRLNNQDIHIHVNKSVIVSIILAMVVLTLMVNTDIVNAHVWTGNAHVWTGYGVKVWFTNIFGRRLAQFGVTLRITLDNTRGYRIVYAHPGPSFTYERELYSDGIISCAWLVSCTSEVTYFVYNKSYAARHRNFMAETVINRAWGVIQIDFLILNSTHAYVSMSYQLNGKTVKWEVLNSVVNLILRSIGLSP